MVRLWHATERKTDPCRVTLAASQGSSSCGDLAITSAWQLGQLQQRSWVPAQPCTTEPPWSLSLTSCLARHPGTLRNPEKAFTEVDSALLLSRNAESAVIPLCNLSRIILGFFLRPICSLQCLLLFPTAVLLLFSSSSAWLRECLQSRRSRYCSHYPF